ncbi:MAG: hypothetical protein CMI53_00090 [Parcubacteria group bacterium]|nr:hypothetical protein [Parcubacteria group bacterium]|tara:strand:- start:8702 stop:9121 length:420 start_codon:yes stop_codon:yes gene_type:complete
MRLILKDKNLYLIRFDRGDEVIGKLISVCKKNKLFSGSISGLGAASEIVISYFDIKKKKYLDKKFKSNLEIVSLTGNLASLGKEPVVHIHGIFSDKNMETVGGHVQKIVVSVTCEITIITSNQKIYRQLDKNTQLNLLK